MNAQLTKKVERILEVYTELKALESELEGLLMGERPAIAAKPKAQDDEHLYDEEDDLEPNPEDGGDDLEPEEEEKEPAWKVYDRERRAALRPDDEEDEQPTHMYHKKAWKCPKCTFESRSRRAIGNHKRGTGQGV